MIVHFEALDDVSADLYANENKKIREHSQATTATLWSFHMG